MKCLKIQQHILKALLLPLSLISIINSRKEIIIQDEETISVIKTKYFFCTSMQTRK